MKIDFFIKRAGLALLFFALLTPCGASKKNVYFFSSFHEPANEGLRMLYSHDGYNWEDLDTILLKPEVGTQKIMRDPSIFQGPDGTFHLVWTSSWRKDKGFGYSSSRDLIHWTKQRHIDVMAYDTSTYNVWAPEGFYDKATKQFIIVWASTIKDFPDHRLFYTTTKDFKTFSQAKLYYNPGYNSIDATLLTRGKNDYVLIFKNNFRPESNIRVAFGKTALGPFERESKPFSKQWTEGPTAVKVGEYWLIYFDYYRNFSYSAVRTKDFLTFEDITDKISVPKNHKHGTIFMSTEKVLKNLKKNFKK